MDSRHLQNKSFYFAGFDAKQTTLDEHLTVLIDYEKYRANQKLSERVGRQAEDTSNVTLQDNHEAREVEIGAVPCVNYEKCGNETSSMCTDSMNEVYQKCGNKCVLGCRYATSSAGITISKQECEQNDCVDGCFCKAGLVRHQNKCIPQSECPIRKCSKNEVHVSAFD